MTAVPAWWNALPLTALSPQQWEALCDGCGRCCLHKLLDDYSEKLFYTRVHCRYLDSDKCRCTDYANRAQNVPDCVVLTPEELAAGTDWLPPTCAYRLRDEGRQLPTWHPLETGDPDSVHRAGISVRGRTLSEEFVHEDGYDEHVVHWVQEDDAC